MEAKKQVSIGQIKRDISDLVNRVAYGGERIVLTSRGKPKAALVSIEDYEQLEKMQGDDKMLRWQAWLNESRRLSEQILARRGDKPIDVDTWWEAAKSDLEARDERHTGH